jgi:hypothetical protein
VSQLALDAYMAQHAGLSTAAGTRSVWTHLVGLWLALERGESASSIQRTLGVVFPDKRSPPKDLSAPALAGVDVSHVLAVSLRERPPVVEEWARFVFAAWAHVYADVVALGEAALLRRTTRATRSQYK